jgi:hypothetical protein
MIGPFMDSLTMPGLRHLWQRAIPTDEKTPSKPRQGTLHVGNIGPPSRGVVHKKRREYRCGEDGPVRTLLEKLVPPHDKRIVRPPEVIIERHIGIHKIDQIACKCTAALQKLQGQVGTIAMGARQPGELPYRFPRKGPQEIPFVRRQTAAAKERWKRGGPTYRRIHLSVHGGNAPFGRNS